MNAPPVRVEQVVDVDTYVVQVSLNADLVLPALARVMRGNTEKLMLIRHLPIDHPAHQRAQAELVGLLADVLTVTLTPAQADHLGGDLYEATTLPTQCEYCEAFSTVAIEGVPHCQSHANAYDTAAQVAK